MFEHLGIGPFVAIDDLKKEQEHIKDILDQGFIPIRLIKDEEHEIFKNFNGEDFNTKAVFVTVYYKKLYE